MTPVTFKPIGVLRSPFIDKFGTPRQGHLVPAMVAEVQWAAQTSPEQWLEGLKGFSHVWLITTFHQNLNQKAPTKIRPPRLNGLSVGVLASRSPHRPNPIGLTLARVVFVEGKKLHLSEVDLIDGTPILDIKPYVQECDSAPQATSGWVSENPWPQLPVFLSDASLKDLDRIYHLAPPPMARAQFEELIKQSLSADPRSVADREDNEKVDGRPRWFWLRLYDLDIGFYFTPRGIEVSQVRPFEPS